MRTLPWLFLSSALVTANLFAATIGFDVSTVGVTPSGATLFRYTYSFANLTLQARQEVDIRFNAAQFGVLSNGAASPGFDLVLLQPNNPQGAPGDYSLFALVNNPLLTGPFRVDFTYTGSGQPGAQAYFINQYDQNGNFAGRIESGFTTPATPTPIPEPTTFGLMGVGALLVGGRWGFRRRFRAGG